MVRATVEYRAITTHSREGYALIMNPRTLLILSMTSLLMGCVTGVTGYVGQTPNDQGDLVEYQFDHPGLKILVKEPRSDSLMVPTSVGEDKGKSFRHTIQFGDSANPSTLLLIGRFRKQVQLNDVCFPSVRRGTLLVSGTEVSLDGDPLNPIACS